MHRKIAKPSQAIKICDKKKKKKQNFLTIAGIILHAFGYIKIISILVNIPIIYLKKQKTKQHNTFTDTYIMAYYLLLLYIV